jgi:TRAP transporter TAXI family solute receptor
MKLAMKQTFFASLAVAAMACFSPAANADQNITLCGGSPGGLWSLLGAGIDAAVREVDPGSNVTYQTSSGGFANIVQLKQKKCDIAIVHVGEVLIAARGDAPFKAPTTGVSAIAMLYDWAPMQWVIDKDYATKNGLSSISDLKDSKAAFNLVVNRRGILPSILAEASLAKSGITFKAIEDAGGSVQFQGSKSASTIMQDGKADAWVNATFVGSGSIKSIAAHRKLTLLSVPKDVIDQMVAEYGSKPVTVPKGAYEWLDHDVETFGAQAALIASDDADPKLVALVAKAIVGHQDKIQGVHKAMKAFDGKLLSSITQFNYHPSAAAEIKAGGL